MSVCFLLLSVLQMSTRLRQSVNASVTKWRLSTRDVVTKSTVGASPWDTISTLSPRTRAHTRMWSCNQGLCHLFRTKWILCSQAHAMTHTHLWEKCKIIREYLWTFFHPGREKKQIWNKLEKKRAEGEKFRGVPVPSVCVIRFYYLSPSEQSPPPSCQLLSIKQRHLLHHLHLRLCERCCHLDWFKTRNVVEMVPNFT